MEVGRVWIDFPTDIFGLKLSLKCHFRSSQLCVQFCYDTKSLFVSRTVFTGASSSLLCSAKRRLHLLFLLRVHETPSCSSCAGDSQQAFRSIGCRTASDLDLEISKRHVVPFLLLCSSDLSSGLFIFWFAIGFTLRPFTSITFITTEQDRYSVDIYRALKASNATIPPELEELANGFLEKVKLGKAQTAGSGFGGKGLDKLDKERDARERAERKAYGEPEDEKAAATTEVTTAEKKDGDDMTFGNFKVEIRRGPAPDTSKGLLGVAGAAAAARRLAHAKEEEKMQSSLRAAEEAAARASKDSPAHKQALSVVAKLNAQLRASKLALQAQLQAEDVSRKVNPDATDFHAIVPINDYPQKARWRVTNKETMVQLIDMTGASVTNKGIYYESGKEPPPDGPPKLHLLIESNEEFRVENAVREIKRLLIEASTAALQAEMRNPTAPTGRYSVV